MPKIQIGSFQGEIPRMEPRYLPETNAASVSGAALTRGHLSPTRQSLLQTVLASVADRIHLFGVTWLSWSHDADAVQGAVANDRLYITRATGSPQMRVYGVTYGLSLPAPTVAPTITNTGTPDPQISEAVIYAFTWVTSLGEESAPSPLSGSIQWSAGNVVTVVTPTTPPSNRLVTLKRIYRTQTSVSGATELFFVAEIPVATSSYSHNATTAPLQEAITTTDFDTPPDDLRGIVDLPNGMMVAFRGREVWFCEPYKHHAWPSKYVLTVNDDIVALAAFGSSVAILTNGTPYVASGLAPDQMVMAKTEVDLPCVSKRGVVDMGAFVLYPSNDGLVQISSAGASLMSAQLWDRAQWQALSPATIRAARFQGRYAMSYQPGGSGTRKLGFIDTTGQMPFFLPGPAEGYIDLIHHLPTGKLFGLRQSDQRTINSIDDAAAAWGTYAWKSKPFFLPGEVAMGVFRIDTLPTASLGVPVQFSASVTRDGVVVRTVTNHLASFHRLPDGLAREFQIEVTGNVTVTGITICGSPDELYQ